MTYDVPQLRCHQAIKYVNYTLLWSIHFCIQWYKNYKNRPKNARVIVENKVVPFYATLCRISVWNLVWILQAVSEKLTKSLRGYFFQTRLVEYMKFPPPHRVMTRLLLSYSVELCSVCVIILVALWFTRGCLHLADGGMVEWTVGIWLGFANWNSFAFV